MTINGHFHEALPSAPFIQLPFSTRQASLAVSLPRARVASLSRASFLVFSFLFSRLLTPPCDVCVVLFGFWMRRVC
ncbi:hypothetical protein EUGRSUZ_H00247 [Eucalyptus grandis]|uniref:Uncharacterized protein n=2 Tax=Eucalyptus grandis TaxID=71139 RepID=A0ACC3JMF4_EUCGR|nr:hypothetical protein EUGRSUZ_H00247 [Eucalyptus grandis]